MKSHPEFRGDPMRKCFDWKKLLLGAGAAVVLSANLMCPPAVEARVKLITLPVRERVEIQLDNAAATLVEEERIVPLVKGENQVDFSWANTQIDPNTIVFRVVAPVGEKMLDVKVLSVSYPPNEAALVWTVGAATPARPACGSATCSATSPRASTTAPSPRRTRRRSSSRSTCGCRTSPTRSSAARASGPASARRFSSRSA